MQKDARKGGVAGCGWDSRHPGRAGEKKRVEARESSANAKESHVESDGFVLKLPRGRSMGRGGLGQREEALRASRAEGFAYQQRCW